MKIKLTAIAAGLAACAFAMTAFAQNAADTTQRDVNQQNRIEDGLKSGQLNTKEAGKLEKEESRVDKMQSNALKDGKMTDAEKARIEKAQNKVSGDIYKEKHDAQTGNPNSASSQRMQADVQRNANQEQRIDNGIKNGTMTNREAASAERGQARVDRKEANAAANGHVGAAEQKNIQTAENRQSRKIHLERGDGRFVDDVDRAERVGEEPVRALVCDDIEVLAAVSAPGFVASQHPLGMS
ncbi:MAG: hypothetical protein ABI771_10475, partial [Betaproteobacteria bacterium]